MADKTEIDGPMTSDYPTLLPGKSGMTKQKGHALGKKTARVKFMPKKYKGKK